MSHDSKAGRLADRLQEASYGEDTLIDAAEAHLALYPACRVFLARPFTEPDQPDQAAVIVVDRFRL